MCLNFTLKGQHINNYLISKLAKTKNIETSK